MRANPDYTKASERLHTRDFEGSFVCFRRVRKKAHPCQTRPVPTCFATSRSLRYDPLAANMGNRLQATAAPDLHDRTKMSETAQALSLERKIKMHEAREAIIDRLALDLPTAINLDRFLNVIVSEL